MNFTEEELAEAVKTELNKRSPKMSKVKKVIIEINGEDVEMTMDEAEELKDSLSELFPDVPETFVEGCEILKPYAPPIIYPYYPLYPVYPDWTYRPGIVTWSSIGENITINGEELKTPKVTTTCTCDTTEGE